MKGARWQVKGESGNLLEEQRATLQLVIAELVSCIQTLVSFIATLSCLPNRKMSTEAMHLRPMYL